MTAAEEATRREAPTLRGPRPVPPPERASWLPANPPPIGHPGPRRSAGVAYAPGGSFAPAGEVPDGPLDYAAIQRTPEFRSLRRRYRTMAFLATALFMSWFLSYVLLSAYDHALMATKVLGEINLGIVLGLAQFVTTILIMVVYSRFADRTLDPIGDELAVRAGERR